MSCLSAVINLFRGIFLCTLSFAPFFSAECYGRAVSQNEPEISGPPITQWETANCYDYSSSYDTCAPPLNESCVIYSSLCDDRCGFFVEMEGLWWTIYQDNLDYAVEFDNGEDADVILGPGDTKFLKYDWEVGGRGCLGYVWCGWDISGTYTWYENKTDTSTNTQSSDTDLKASLLHPSTPQENAEKASINSQIKYQTAEILIGRKLSFCENSLSLHPFFGGQAIQIEQDLSALYQGEDFVVTDLFIGGADATPGRVKWDSDLQAIGLNAGLDMDYRWYCGFGLYGKFRGSVLASKTDIHHKQEELDSNGQVTSTPIDLREKEHVIIPGYQISAGISWDGNCGDCLYFIIKAGYEFNHWFNTPQLRRYHNGNGGVSSDSSGNIGLHGATLSINLFF